MGRQKSLFIVKTEGKSSSGETMRMMFSDFRKINGNWEFPYKVEAYINVKPMFTFLVKSLKYNQGLSDDLFNVNKVEIQGPNLQEMMQNMMKSGVNN